MLFLFVFSGLVLTRSVWVTILRAVSYCANPEASPLDNSSANHRDLPRADQANPCKYLLMSYNGKPLNAPPKYIRMSRQLQQLLRRAQPCVRDETANLVMNHWMLLKTRSEHVTRTFNRMEAPQRNMHECSITKDASFGSRLRQQPRGLCPGEPSPRLDGPGRRRVIAQKQRSKAERLRDWCRKEHSHN